MQHIVELKPEICSLDMGSMNMGPYVFVNTPGYLETVREIERRIKSLVRWNAMAMVVRANRLHPADGGDLGGHELHAKPAARELAVVRLRHIASPVSDGGAGRAARRPPATSASR